MNPSHAIDLAILDTKLVDELRFQSPTGDFYTYQGSFNEKGVPHGEGYLLKEGDLTGRESYEKKAKILQAAEVRFDKGVLTFFQVSDYADANDVKNDWRQELDLSPEKHIKRPSPEDFLRSLE